MPTKTKKVKFTFKKNPIDRRGAMGKRAPNVTIKLGGMWVGTIYAPTWSSPDKGWGLALIVSGCDGNPNCAWHWETIEGRFATEAEARDYVTKNAEALSAMSLHGLEPQDD